MTSPWWFLALCCILGRLTSALPTEQPAPSADDVIVSQLAGSDDDETGELEDWTESLPPRAVALERHLDLYERAAVNMADEDLFPVHLCEKSSLNRMHRALSFIPHDAVLRALLMVTMMQSEGCREGALHTATKLRELIKSPTPQHDVIKASDVTGKQQGGQAAKDHCSLVAECRWRGVAEVRAIMADEADLLLLYDTVAAAIFGASGRTRVARALGRDLLLDLQDEQARHMTRAKRSWDEPRLQYWVGWVPAPYVSAIYNTASAVYYGARGDYGLARDRAASAVLDMAVPVPLRRYINRIPWRLGRWSAETVARKGVEAGTGYK